jgi:hypothetical protein
MWKSIFAAAIATMVLAASWGTLPAIAATDPPAAATKRPSTPGQIAMRERQKKCAAEWAAAKAAGKTGGLKWPQFWSACNKRLKGQTH